VGAHTTHLTRKTTPSSPRDVSHALGRATRGWGDRQRAHLGHDRPPRDAGRGAVGSGRGPCEAVVGGLRRYHALLAWGRGDEAAPRTVRHQTAARRTRCIRGASFSSSSTGASVMPVVPSDHGRVQVERRSPPSSASRRSSDTAPRAVERIRGRRKACYRLGRAHPWPGGFRTRWMTNKISWRTCVLQSQLTHRAWSHCFAYPLAGIHVEQPVRILRRLKLAISCHGVRRAAISWWQ
jgi:hypothetical protein